HNGCIHCHNEKFPRPITYMATHHIDLHVFDSVSLCVSVVRIELPLGGLYNAYNALAAFAAGSALGFEPTFIANRFGTVQAAFGRQERLDAKGRKLNIVLSKNPAGFNEPLRTAVDLAGGRWFLI